MDDDTIYKYFFNMSDKIEKIDEDYKLFIKINNTNEKRLKLIEDSFNLFHTYLLEIDSKNQERYVRQIDENRKVDRILNDLEDKLERQLHINIQLNERLIKLEEYMKHPGKRLYDC